LGLVDLDFMSAYNEIISLAAAQGFQQKLPTLLNYFETVSKDIFH
jgi:hypothetical protein